MISVCVAGMALTGTFPADAKLPSAAQAAVSAEANAEKIEGKVVDKEPIAEPFTDVFKFDDFIAIVTIHKHFYSWIVAIAINI